jgi:hypothetical protein
MAYLAEVSGWLGALAVLAGYLLFSLGWIQNGRLFQSANLAGSAAMIINGSYHGAWPSVVTNIAWCAIAAAALVRLRQLGHTAAVSRETPVLEEDELLPPLGPAGRDRPGAVAPGSCEMDTGATDELWRQGPKE